jgi:SAM-dependent methyltransferase
MRGVGSRPSEEVTAMESGELSSGSGGRWGPLFGARAGDWAETWEGPGGWGGLVYERVLDRTVIGPATSVLDCGCGAGRFLQLATARGAKVAGIDAAGAMVQIAAERTPEADLRVGDLEDLPWGDGSFDVVTGFSSFQFADDKARALAEARRVARRQVVVVIPTRVPEAGITQVFQPLFQLFPAEALEVMKQSGMFALSAPGRLEEVLAAAGLEPREDDDVQSLTVFKDADTAMRAFAGAGPTALAIRHSGEEAVADALRHALVDFTDDDGAVRLRGWYRVVVADT